MSRCVLPVYSKLCGFPLLMGRGLGHPGQSASDVPDDTLQHEAWSGPFAGTICS